MFGTLMSGFLLISGLMQGAIELRRLKISIHAFDMLSF